MEPWLKPIIDRLASSESFIYRSGQSSASEPAALCAMALLAHDRFEAAARALQWLTGAQQSSGAVGVRAEPGGPQWPTALAILAWRSAIEAQPEATPLEPCVERAVEALLQLKGKPGQHTRDMIGHDPRLVAWSWCADTHSWIEPTALAVMALKATGRATHKRTREAVQLLLDRQLKSGGCNYGNTSVLGQQLRPHIQPTGMALAALGNEPADPRITRSLEFLNRNWRQNSAASLSWALMGLAAHGVWPEDAVSALEQVSIAPASQEYGTYHEALIALAASGDANPLLQLLRRQDVL